MNPVRPKILCIDADAATAKWISGKLLEANVACEVISVSTGRDAFRRLNGSENFDLCVLEYALPDMTGVQLCSLMRQMGSGVPMLFFTPMNRAVDREHAEAAGASAYLVKPDEMELFVDTAEHLLKRSVRNRTLAFRRFDYAKAA